MPARRGAGICARGAAAGSRVHPQRRASRGDPARALGDRGRARRQRRGGVWLFYHASSEHRSAARSSSDGPGAAATRGADCHRHARRRRSGGDRRRPHHPSASAPSASRRHHRRGGLLLRLSRLMPGGRRNHRSGHCGRQRRGGAGGATTRRQREYAGTKRGGGVLAVESNDARRSKIEYCPIRSGIVIAPRASVEHNARGTIGAAMPFEIEFTQPAVDHVRGYKKFEQKIILDAIADQLSEEPTTETKNRKAMRKNELSDWELRVRKFRVFYDVMIEKKRRIVKIKAVGHKEHNTLFVAGKEVEL